MARVRCLSCAGEFDTVLPDGTRYFHACPPLSRVELQAAVAAGRVVLPAGETVDDAIQRRTYERANKRDENPPSTRPEDAGRVTADGRGVEPAPPKPPAVVVVPV